VLYEPENSSGWLKNIWLQYQARCANAKELRQATVQ
jgi:hypothetical protein